MQLNLLADFLPTALGVGIPALMAIGAGLASRTAPDAPSEESLRDLLARPRQLVQRQP